MKRLFLSPEGGRGVVPVSEIQSFSFRLVPRDGGVLNAKKFPSLPPLRLASCLCKIVDLGFSWIFLQEKNE